MGAVTSSNGIVPTVIERDAPAIEQDKELVLMRADLREAIDESGWKHDALAAAMSRASGLSIDGPYISKMLSGDKPLRDVHIAALPNDIEAMFYAKRAGRHGQIVVAPLTGLAAQKAFVAGLIGLMSAPATLPARADHLAKATLRSPVKGGPA